MLVGPQAPLHPHRITRNSTGNQGLIRRGHHRARVFLAAMCRLRSFAICLRVHLLPGMDEIAGLIEE
jgi:hypothetical protein